MKAGLNFIFISLSLMMAAEVSSAEPVVESRGPPSSSAVRRRIMELLKQDVTKIPVKPKEATAPFLNPETVINDQPIAEGVLELEPIQVTKKKPIELPLRINPITLDNFFYGDGKIAESASKRVVLSAGPDGIKFTLKF